MKNLFDARSLESSPTLCRFFAVSTLLVVHLARWSRFYWNLILFWVVDKSRFSSIRAREFNRIAIEMVQEVVMLPPNKSRHCQCKHLTFQVPINDNCLSWCHTLWDKKGLRENFWIKNCLQIFFMLFWVRLVSSSEWESVIHRKKQSTGTSRTHNMLPSCVYNITQNFSDMRWVFSFFELSSFFFCGSSDCREISKNRFTNFK